MSDMIRWGFFVVAVTAGSGSKMANRYRWVGLAPVCTKKWLYHHHRFVNRRRRALCTSDKLFVKNENKKEPIRVRATGRTNKNTQ